MFHNPLAKVKAKVNLSKTATLISTLVGVCLLSETPVFAISLNSTSNFIGTEIDKKTSPSSIKWTIEGGLEVDNTLYHYFNVFDVPNKYSKKGTVKFDNDSNIKTIVVKADAYNIWEFDGRLEANGSVDFVFLNLGVWNEPLTSSQFNKFNRELKELDIEKGIDIELSEQKFITSITNSFKFNSVEILQTKNSEGKIQILLQNDIYPPKYKQLSVSNFAPKNSVSFNNNQPEIGNFYQIIVIPEPFTILGSITAIGFGVFIKKNNSQAIKQQEEEES